MHIKDIENLLSTIIKPELNRIYTEAPSQRGGGDMGLFCKEHAFHCWALGRLLGFQTTLKRGELTFKLDRETKYTSFKSGLGHAWCQCADIFPVDLSANFEFYPRDCANIDIVFGAGQRGNFRISYMYDPEEYEKAIETIVTHPFIAYLERRWCPRKDGLT